MTIDFNSLLNEVLAAYSAFSAITIRFGDNIITMMDLMIDITLVAGIIDLFFGWANKDTSEDEI